MLPNLKTAAISAVTALSIAMTTASPAAAWGQREQDFVKGAAAALLLKAIIDDAKRDRAPAPVYREAPRVEAEKHYRSDEDDRYKSKPGRVIGGSIYQTTTAQAFNSYSRSERRLIQKRLAHWGYYRGGLDGKFGPGTYSAITAYANDQGTASDMRSMAGAYGVLDSLIY